MGLWISLTLSPRCKFLSSTSDTNRALPSAPFVVALSALITLIKCSTTQLPLALNQILTRSPINLESIVKISKRREHLALTS